MATAHMRCHRGHDNPVGLWNCPECTDRALDLARHLVLSLEDCDRVLGYAGDPPTHIDVTAQVTALREALWLEESGWRRT